MNLVDIQVANKDLVSRFTSQVEQARAEFTKIIRIALESKECTTDDIWNLYTEALQCEGLLTTATWTSDALACVNNARPTHKHIDLYNSFYIERHTVVSYANMYDTMHDNLLDWKEDKTYYNLIMSESELEVWRRHVLARYVAHCVGSFTNDW